MANNSQENSIHTVIETKINILSETKDDDGINSLSSDETITIDRTKQHRENISKLLFLNIVKIVMPSLTVRRIIHFLDGPLTLNRTNDNISMCILILATLTI